MKHNGYRIVEFRPNRWHIVDPDGHLVYDKEPYGNDKPVIFDGEDTAYEFVCSLVETNIREEA